MVIRKHTLKKLFLTWFNENHFLNHPMQKQTIKSHLLESHHSFISYLDTLTEQELQSAKDDKWSAVQQLEHIHLSVQPVGLVFGFPKFLLKLIWGKANRTSLSYDDLVKKYMSKLEKGGKASGRFVPKEVSYERALKLKVVLKNEVEKLVRKLDNFTEDDLDKYVLPHPLLGKLTLREMLCFTIYHVKHHEEIVKRDLE
jgi:hypothetical protein